jgi:hypothetical protein
LLKLASNLKIGPSISNNIGFDLIVYDSCIEFVTEKCIPSKKIDEKIKI